MTEREVMADLVRFVGVITYGKERWFKQSGCWYDRLFGDYIQNETLLERIGKAIEDEVRCDSANRPTGEWQDRHGKPMRLGSFAGYCSNCGKWSEYLTDYCGNCGARMFRKDGE